MNASDFKWDLLDAKPGHIAFDWHEKGMRVIVLRGPASWNAYVGVPVDHPAAGHSYDDVPVSVHGGLTFSSEGKGTHGFAEGYWWYGWDYAHSGDCADYYHRESIGIKCHGEKHWTAEEVKQEASFALYDFERVMRLCEKSSGKSLTTPAIEAQ